MGGAGVVVELWSLTPQPVVSGLVLLRGFRRQFGAGLQAEYLVTTYQRIIR